ncbi:MAG TPA: AAA family ATPase [Dermatophilaceae bacterium]|nr:AAA family ATPase [Dermatophilaceae bacterium]
MAPMLVEREDGLAALAAAAERALAGDGRLVLVAGEAGVGKTTLVRAATDLLTPVARVRRGVVDNVTTAAALGSFVDAVPELSSLTDEAAKLGRGRAAREPSQGADAVSGQHSMTLTASPPRAVSLYFTLMSAPVSRIVLIALSNDT